MDTRSLAWKPRSASASDGSDNNSANGRMAKRIFMSVSLFPVR